MKRTILSIIHVLLAAAAFILFASSANDVYCQINVELIEPVTMMGMPDIYKEEITEILIERVVFEETNPFAINEVFQIDTSFYRLVRVPTTGEQWSNPWTHSE